MAEVGGIGAIGAGRSVMPVADMTAGTRAVRTQGAQNAPDTRKAAEESSEKRQQLEQESQEKRQRILENVISTSKDGDTVQASQKAMEQLKEDEEDGRVVDKNSLMAQKEVTTVAGSGKERLEALKEAEAKAKEEAKARRAEAEEARDGQQGSVTSLNAYSDAQLKQLYLKGDISKQSYDSEIEKRESELEDTKEQNAVFQKESARNVGRMEENARDAVEIKNLGSQDSSDAPDAMMRAMVLSSLDANSIFNENQ